MPAKPTLLSAVTEQSVFGRPQDLSDEVNSYAYNEAESHSPFTVTSTRTNNVQSSPAMSHSRLSSRVGGSAKRDLMALKRVVNMTASLQSEQDTAEAQKEAEMEHEEARLRRERNAKWEAVKARMSARPTPLHSVRAYDSDCSDSEGEDDEVSAYKSEMLSLRASTRSNSMRTALDALTPSLTEERVARSGALIAVESVPERVMHFLYNWWMYFVYALSMAVMPGVDAHKGMDSKEYYNRRKYE